MTTSDPLAKAAKDLADIIYRLDREWDAAGEAIDDDDERDALRTALEQGFPFTQSLEDVSAAAADWAEHVAEVMAKRPTVLGMVAKEIAGDVMKLATDLNKREPDKDPDAAHRDWQNGGLGAETGRVGGIFTPTVMLSLARLLVAIDEGKQVHEKANELAREYRKASKQSNA